MTSSFLLRRRFPGGFMITKEQIDRINQLARKSKTPEGLTDAEKAEQQLLRRQYIDAFKANLKSQLDNIEFVDEDEVKKS